jgi:hypothetical protein
VWCIADLTGSERPFQLTLVQVIKFVLRQVWTFVIFFVAITMFVFLINLVRLTEEYPINRLVLLRSREEMPQTPLQFPSRLFHSSLSLSSGR